MPRGVPRRWHVTLTLQSGRVHDSIYRTAQLAKTAYDDLVLVTTNSGRFLTYMDDGSGWIVPADRIESITWGDRL